MQTAAQRHNARLDRIWEKCKALKTITIQCSTCPSVVIGRPELAYSYARANGWHLVHAEKAKQPACRDQCPVCQHRERKAKVESKA